HQVDIHRGDVLRLAEYRIHRHGFRYALHQIVWSGNGTQIRDSGSTISRVGWIVGISCTSSSLQEVAELVVDRIGIIQGTNPVDVLHALVVHADTQVLDPFIGETDV